MSMYQQPPPQSAFRRFLARKEMRGCGCALVVAALIGAGLFFVYWKFFRDTGPKLPEPSGGELRVVTLNVGQGDSILIIAPSGKTALVDASNPGNGKRILEAMQRYGADHIDLLIATHAHTDHIGAADEVMRGTKVGTVLDSGVPHAIKNYEDFLRAVGETQTNLVRAEPGQRFDLGGGVVITVLAPIPPKFEKKDLREGGNEPNANSVVARLDYGQFSMLLTGDAEAQTEARIMQNGGNVKTRILKVGHHGSKYATSEEFIRAGGFEAAVISCGDRNEYGHPSPELLNRLRSANVKVYRTDLQGEIVITSRGEGYEIKPEREAKGDVWAGREPKKRDTASSGFIDPGDFSTPPRPTPAKKGAGAGGR